MYWAAGCGGCEISVLDLQERLLQVAESVEIVFWPAVMDAKKSDVEAMPEGHIDLCLFNGALRTEENLEMARLLRRKSTLLVAYGSCAVSGGVPGLADLTGSDSVLARAFDSAFSNDGDTRPALRTSIGEVVLELPGLLPRVMSLSSAVPVDLALPGCPPATERIWETLMAALGSPESEAGSIGAVCDDCGLVKTGAKVDRFVRPFEARPDGERCLLEQGVLCVGPATRGGCGAQCLSVGVGCRGCYGPTDGVRDHGAAITAMLAAVIGPEDEAGVEDAVAGLKDVAGAFYRYTLPASILLSPAAGKGDDDE
jgi:F420-non-reducing hydrogenase small subunit